MITLLNVMQTLHLMIMNFHLMSIEHVIGIVMEHVCIFWSMFIVQP